MSNAAIMWAVWAVCAAADVALVVWWVRLRLWAKR